MKVAVVGHIEWGRFARVERLPVSGDIMHAVDYWEEVAGGGSVAAMQLALLNGECTFFTKIGNDRAGTEAISQLEKSGVEVFAAVDENQPTKSMFVHIDKDKERAITVVGDLTPSGNDSLPWEKLKEMDAVYFVSGDSLSLQYARSAKVLVSTARILPLLKEAGIQLDALVRSSKDKSEVYADGDISPSPRLVVTTDGAQGGKTDKGLTYSAQTVAESDIVDFYGCGDSFAAGLTFALGSDASIEDALDTAAKAGAQAVLRRGAFGN